MSTCPSDLLDTIYPMNVVDHWMSMFLREARMDYGSRMFSKAEIEGDFTNHSLRATGDINPFLKWST